MTPEEREKMEYLCKQIQTEKNPQIFDQLVRELNDLIEVKHGRIHPEHKGDQAQLPQVPPRSDTPPAD